MASRRVLVGVLAGALMMSLLAVPAAGAPRSQRVADGDRDGRVAAAVQQGRERLPSGPGTFSTAPGQPGGRATVTEILTGARNRRDLGNWLGAMADAIAATSGAEVAVAASGTDRSGGTVAAAGHDEGEGEYVPYTGSWAETYPAGDLDGDGRGDAVTYHLDLETWTLSLEAVRGDTGAVLWQRDGRADGGLAWPLRQDLTGDGAADLLAFSLDILSDSFEECWESGEEDCWNEPWEATFAWTIGLVSGRDGATAWSRNLDGWIRESFSGPAGSTPVTVEVGEERIYEFAGENVDILPFVADLDGTGTPEVILNAIDFSERFTATGDAVRSPLGSAGRWEGGWSLDSATRVSVISGSGAELHQLFDGGAGRIAVLWPLEQPDGAADVVWERSVYGDTQHECVYVDVAVDLEYCPTDDYGEDAFEVVVLDGASFEQRWAKTVDGYGTAWPLGGDLDADGRNDVAIWSIDWDTWQDRAELLSGATGAALWDEDVLIRGVLAAGPLDGAPGDDVVAVDYDDVYDDATDTYTTTVHFQRRNGATGALLGQTSHTAQDRAVDNGYDFEWLYATSGSDGSGDGALDLTVGKVVLEIREVEDEDEDDPYWFTFRFGDSSAVAESGATGEQLYAFSNAGFGLLRMTGDFDGDGLSDAAQVAEGSDDEAATASFAPVRLAGGAGPLWTDAAGGDYVFYTWGADNGGAAAYRHVDTLSESNRWSTVVTALDGRTGTGRWSVISRP
jgi:hypothetical protein